MVQALEVIGTEVLGVRMEHLVTVTTCGGLRLCRRLNLVLHPMVAVTWETPRELNAEELQQLGLDTGMSGSLKDGDAPGVTEDGEMVYFAGRKTQLCNDECRVIGVSKQRACITHLCSESAVRKQCTEH